MTRRLGLLACLALLSLGTGCATIVHGSTQKIQVTSEPPGATVTVLPEKITLVTPGEVKLARKKSHTLLFELACHAPSAGYLDRRVSQWIHGNLVIGGLAGLSADAGSGGAWNLIPGSVHVRLERLPPPEDDGALAAQCASESDLAGAEPGSGGSPSP
jgi:hypothetical protein